MASGEIAETIDRQEWLEGVANPLQKAVHGALDNAGPLKDLLHGVWLGHPLHPVITDIPVGAWTVALVLDAAAGMTGREDLEAGADLAIGVGVLGAVGSAVTGLADWSETDYRAKKIGVVHGLMNVVATSLYTASWVMRGKSRSRNKAVTLAMLGYAISGAAAYLGGHLVFGEQVGVDHTATANADEPQKFAAVMKMDELKENKPARAMANGIAVLLVRRGDDIHALSETCPHLGGPLADGKLVGDAIECPWHGSQLSIEDGRVVAGPTTYPARCFEVRVREGMIEVRRERR